MLIDKNVLNNLTQDLGSEVLESLISIYVEDTGNTISKLQQAVQMDDYAALALEAHTLKSVSATYGASDALELSRDIDARCKRSVPMVELVPDVNKLIMVLQATITELEKMSTSGTL